MSAAEQAPLTLLHQSIVEMLRNAHKDYARKPLGPFRLSVQKGTYFYRFLISLVAACRLLAHQHAASRLYVLTVAEAMNTLIKKGSRKSDSAEERLQELESNYKRKRSTYAVGFCSVLTAAPVTGARRTARTL